MPSIMGACSRPTVAALRLAHPGQGRKRRPQAIRRPTEKKFLCRPHRTGRRRRSAHQIVTPVGGMLMRRRDREPLGMTAGLFAFLAVLLCGPANRAEAADLRGVWLVDNQVAVELFPCNDGLCGRIVGLSEPRDNAGRPKHDRRNPDPALRERPLCGLGVLSGLKPVAPGSWEGGTFYNPQTAIATAPAYACSRTTGSPRASMSACRCSAKAAPSRASPAAARRADSAARRAR